MTNEAIAESAPVVEAPALTLAVSEATATPATQPIATLAEDVPTDVDEPEVPAPAPAVEDAVKDASARVKRVRSLSPEPEQPPAKRARSASAEVSAALPAEHTLACAEELDAALLAEPAPQDAPWAAAQPTVKPAVELAPGGTEPSFGLPLETVPAASSKQDDDEW